MLSRQEKGKGREERHVSFDPSAPASTSFRSDRRPGRNEDRSSLALQPRKEGRSSAGTNSRKVEPLRQGSASAKELAAEEQHSAARLARIHKLEERVKRFELSLDTQKRSSARGSQEGSPASSVSTPEDTSRRTEGVARSPPGPGPALLPIPIALHPRRPTTGSSSSAASSSSVSAYSPSEVSFPHLASRQSSRSSLTSQPPAPVPLPFDFPNPHQEQLLAANILPSAQRGIPEAAKVGREAHGGAAKAGQEQWLGPQTQPHHAPWEQPTTYSDYAGSSAENSWPPHVQQAFPPSPFLYPPSSDAPLPSPDRLSQTSRNLQSRSNVDPWNLPPDFVHMTPLPSQGGPPSQGRLDKRNNFSYQPGPNSFYLPSSPVSSEFAHKSYFPANNLPPHSTFEPYHGQPSASYPGALPTVHYSPFPLPSPTHTPYASYQDPPAFTNNAGYQPQVSSTPQNWSTVARDLDQYPSTFRSFPSPWLDQRVGVSRGGERGDEPFAKRRRKT